MSKFSRFPAQPSPSSFLDVLEVLSPNYGYNSALEFQNLPSSQDPPAGEDQRFCPGTSSPTDAGIPPLFPFNHEGSLVTIVMLFCLLLIANFLFLVGFSCFCRFQEVSEVS